ncbi:MAG: tRNA threonylcarbamoyladenosine dehydratase [Lactobacillales bacterium]|nr:tRNA threonylcarbamoyladenosine dehydratase [Lactobacillales bacterium]
MLDRLELLVGKENLEKIKNTKVLIVGIGGVGGYTLESLVRSGIESITIVDYDKIDITNLNRQIIALNSNIGNYKVEEAKKRIEDINKKCNIKIINEKISLDNFDILNIESYDYVVDACDTVEVKKEIIRRCLKNNIKFISSMGTGFKMDPSKLQIMDVRKTSYDPLAKIIRKMVKDEKLKGKIMVVSSTEEKKGNSKVIASNSFVPAIAGLMCTSYVINDIVGEKNESK